MKRILLLCLVALPAIAGESAFVLPVEQGPKVFEQCSRGAPNDADGFWAPTTAQIVTLENGLEVYLKDHNPKLLPLVQHHRQYIGFTRGSKRYIYGNFYPAQMLHGRPDRPFDEKKQPVVVCDGGDYFWGVVYSMDSKSFKDLHYNGVA